jgi:hypothetical protein
LGSEKEKYTNETNFVSNLLVKTVQRIGGQTTFSKQVAKEKLLEIILSSTLSLTELPDSEAKRGTKKLHAPEETDPMNNQALESVLQWIIDRNVHTLFPWFQREAPHSDGGAG